MKIIFDTETRRFSMRPDLESEILMGISEELCHNLIRVIQRPNSSSVDHWMNEEVYGFLCRVLTHPSTVRRRRLEYIFSHLGNYCNNDKYFYLVKESIDVMNDKVINEPYGQSRELPISTVGYGLWIFYKLLGPNKIIYSKLELKSLISNWIDIIILDPVEWELASGVECKSVRLFSGNKVFSYILNY